MTRPPSMRHYRAALLAAAGVLLLTACAPAAPAPTSAPKTEAKPAAPAAPAAQPTTAAPAAAKPTAVPAAAQPAKPAGPARKTGGTLRIATSGDWRTLDPPVYANVTDRQVIYALYNTLVAMDEK